MHTSVRTFIDACGGYRDVAARLGMKPTSLHSHLAAGVMPAKLFKACCDLALEVGVAPPPMSLFNFATLPGAKVVEDAA